MSNSLDKNDINSILNALSQKINMSPDELKKAVLNGDIAKIKSSMPKDKAEKFNSFMNNKDILNSKDLNKTINDYLNKRW